jgi:hypothetical protein
MPTIPLFDDTFARLGESTVSFTQGDALGTLWGQGEDAWLREDERFRPTPWGRWIAANRYLINDVLVAELGLKSPRAVKLDEQLAIVAGLVGAPTSFCPGDPRLVFDAEKRTVRLVPDLTDIDGDIEKDIPPLLQFVTHLPVYDLAAVAASDPAGEWGLSAEPRDVRCLGWVEVSPERRPIHRAEFVGRVRGHSMDGGRPAIRDGKRAIFRFAYHEGIAYDSGKAKPIVLVRAAHTDPELGAYGLKHWLRGGAEVTLVSRNRDKATYPDIIVPADRLHEVRIVAEWDRPFDPEAKAIDPPGKGGGGTTTPPRRPEREVDDDALRKRAFPRNEGEPDEPDEPETPKPTEPDAPTFAWVCLPADEGGPHLVLGSFGEMIRPAITKLLFTDDRGASFFVLTGNVRARVMYQPVSPGSGPWRCAPVGFEAHTQQLGFDALSCASLPTDCVTVCPVDGDGMGRPVQRTSVRVGQPVHLLVPPGLTTIGAGSPLAGGWRQLTLCPGFGDAALLDSLGLKLERAAPTLRWVATSPHRWNQRKGPLVAVFSPEDEPILAIDGLCETVSEGYVLAVCRPDALERLVLPIRPSSRVRLSSREVGQWTVLVTHKSADLPEARLTFEVEAAAHAVVPAAVTLGQLDPPSGTTRLDLSADAVWCEQTSPTAPPGWPVAARWRGGAKPWCGHAVAGADGTVAGLLEPLALQRIAEATAVGILEVDFGELGRFRIEHRRRSDPALFRRWFAARAPQARRLLAARPGDLQFAFGRWIEPLLGTLGYTLGSAAAALTAAAPADVALYAAYVDDILATAERTQPRRRLVSAVAVVESAETVLAGDTEWLEVAMRRLSVEATIVTDGTRFCLRRRGVRTPVDVHELAESQTDTDLDQFLGTFAGAY